MADVRSIMSSVTGAAMTDTFDAINGYHQLDHIKMAQLTLLEFIDDGALDDDTSISLPQP